MLAALLWLGVASAADWPMIQGTDVGRPDKAFVPGGFLQVEAEGYVFAPPVEGLGEHLAEFDGERPIFNGLASTGLSVRRARLIFRGSVPDTEQRVSWLVAAELGDNLLTRESPVVLTDASATFSYIPGMRLRVGQFKLPVMDETLQIKPVTAEFVAFSEAARLLLQNRVEAGAYVGGVDGFRDVGIQAFDTFEAGPLALSYAAMVSNGRAGEIDADDRYDVAGRLQVAWPLEDAPVSPHRDEIALVAWRLQGDRVLDGETATRIRQGFGVNVVTGPLHAGSEWVFADGMIEHGPNPPFPGQPIVVDADGSAWGGTVFGRWDFGPVAVGARWSTLRREGEKASDTRVFHTVTPAVRFEPADKVRIAVNYEWRMLFAPDGSPDALRIADAMGDRVVVEATVVF